MTLKQILHCFKPLSPTEPQRFQLSTGHGHLIHLGEHIRNTNIFIQLGSVTTAVAVM